MGSYIDTNSILMESCSKEEYQTLHELEIAMVADVKDTLFIRARVYNLVASFVNKLVNRKSTELINTTVHYEQMMLAETLIMENLEKAPTVDLLAKKVNLSVSSLLRQFKLVFGKGIYEYYVARKMEIAKKIILENNITVKELAEMLGYKQPSAFIETFMKQHGCSPGALKIAGDQRIFF
jgi:AraC-like DNA-binding protein